ncbi:hypothetical protein KM043_002477 [Ampulex compressa]|nr:hypothetical protein KM043_002477 [Ampulex compressa]
MYPSKPTKKGNLAGCCCRLWAKCLEWTLEGSGAGDERANSTKPKEKSGPRMTQGAKVPKRKSPVAGPPSSAVAFPEECLTSLLKLSTERLCGPPCFVATEPNVRILSPRKEAYSD